MTSLPLWCALFLSAPLFPSALRMSYVMSCFSSTKKEFRTLQSCSSGFRSQQGIREQQRFSVFLAGWKVSNCNTLADIRSRWCLLTLSRKISINSSDFGSRAAEKWKIHPGIPVRSKSRKLGQKQDWRRGFFQHWLGAIEGTGPEMIAPTA